MSTFVELDRSSYLRASISPDRLNFLSAHYKNIRFLVSPTQRYNVKIFDQCNAPGIAFNVYGDKGYWWVICQYAGVLDPYTEFRPGRVLNLPSLADLNSFLTRQSSATSVGSDNVITI
jgi:hypothetical protein